MPPLAAASRAGFGPTPAWTTLPKITASTWSPVRPARDRAARIAIPPSSGALSEDSAPRSFPIGVRAPATSTGWGISGLLNFLAQLDRADEQLGDVDDLEGFLGLAGGLLGVDRVAEHDHAVGAAGGDGVR